MRGEGADGPVVVKKPGNTGGAKRPDNPAEETGQPMMGGAGVRGKPYNIPKQLVWRAYREVKANHGAGAAGGASIPPGLLWLPAAPLCVARSRRGAQALLAVRLGN